MSTYYVRESKWPQQVRICFGFDGEAPVFDKTREFHSARAAKVTATKIVKEYPEFWNVIRSAKQTWTETSKGFFKSWDYNMGFRGAYIEVWCPADNYPPGRGVFYTEAISNL